MSDTRRRVREVFDAASAEMIRRYREGEIDVSALLAEEVGVGPEG